jgi:hypothetical protein
MHEEEEEHVPEGIEYKHREPKEKDASRVGERSTPEGMPEPGGEGGPPA